MADDAYREGSADILELLDANRSIRDLQISRVQQLEAVKLAEEALIAAAGLDAEGIEIIFDPAKTSYRQILEFFFQIHDPTTKNRQGNDVGTQYRSGIYTHSNEQALQARSLIEQLSASGVYASPIVTEVVEHRPCRRDGTT